MKLYLSLIILISSSLFSQTYMVKGIATDKRTETVLSGVNIFIPGTRIGDLTNIEGIFLLRIAGSGAEEVEAIISAKKSGYKNFTGKIKLKEGETVKVKIEMEEDIFHDDEEMISSLSSLENTQKELPFSTILISEKEIKDSHARNLRELMKTLYIGGRVYGSGSILGNANLVLLKGKNSFFGQITPVYYIDGMKVDADVSTGGIDAGGQAVSRYNDIDIENIEKIEILTGPVSTALYGPDGVNGVIQIYTKKGLPNQKDLYTKTVTDVKSYSHFNFANPQTKTVLERGSGTQKGTFVGYRGGRQDHLYFLSIKGNINEGNLANDFAKKYSINGNYNFNISSQIQIAVNTRFAHEVKSRGLGENSQFGVYSKLLDTQNSIPFTDYIKDYENTKLEDEASKFTGSAYFNYLYDETMNLNAQIGFDFTQQEDALLFKALGQKEAFYKKNDMDKKIFSTSLLFTKNFIFSESSNNIFNFGITTNFDFGARGSKQTLGNEPPQYNSLKSPLYYQIIEKNFYNISSNGIFINNFLKLDKSFVINTGIRLDNTSFDEITNKSINTQFSASYIYRLSKNDYFKTFAGFGNSIRLPNRTDYITYNKDVNLIDNRGSIKFEKVTEIVIGGNATLLDGQLKLQVSYFNNKVSDMYLIKSAIEPNGSNYNTQIKNSGEMSINGLDIMGSGYIYREKNFSWFSNVHLITQAENILSTDETNSIISNSDIAVGNTGITAYGTGQSSPELYLPYIIGYDSLNNPIISSTKKFAGNTIPTFTGLISNEFKYKNIRARILLDFAYGQHMLNLTDKYRRYNNLDTKTKNDSELFLADDVEKSDWLKIREISLNYEYTLDEFFIKNVVISIAAKNIGTFSNYSGLDPEVMSFYNGSYSTMGVDFRTLPDPRIYSLTLQIGL